MKYLKINIMTVIASLLISSTAFAHVRWFVEESGTSAQFEWTALYYVLIGLAVVYALFSFVVDRRLEFIYQHAFFKRWQGLDQWSVLGYACGITLVFISFENIFIAPNIEILQGLDQYLIIQAVCGIVLLSALPRWAGGIAVLVLCVMTAQAVPMSVWIDYIFEFVAVGIALGIVRWAPNMALTILRVGLGLQLMVLAVHNKLMDPTLGLSFLSDYNWNFMKLMGVTAFNDLLFVYAAGVAELTFGLLILFAIGTRFVIFSVSFFFMLTSILLGMHELIGHVPIIACCIVVLSLGHGYNFSDTFKKLNESIFEPVQLYFAHKRA